MSTCNELNDKDNKKRSSIQDLPNFSKDPAMNTRGESAALITGRLSETISRNFIQVIVVAFA